MTSHENNDSLFDNLLKKVGNDGPFQRRFNILFNFFLLIFVTMANLNLFIAMFVPDHWCRVPGRDDSNYSLDEWKTRTIPRNNINTSYSNCKMFDINTSSVLTDEYLGESLSEKIVDCQYGWEYDKTWYAVTAPSQENWVCDKELHVTNTFVFARIGDLAGNLIFGQLGDMFGRLPIYYLTLTTLISGRMMSAFTANSVSWFMFASFFGSLAATAVFQAPLVIAMEISKSDDRAYIAMLQCVGWTIGFCIMPMVMWILRDWVVFMLITTLPCAVFLFAHKFLIESPRWLASTGKSARCIKQLETIAKINKMEVTDDLAVLVEKASVKSEKAYGLMSLFTNFRLAKHTILLASGWAISNLIYFVLTLNVNNLGGNPFMNFFWQGLAELPAYLLGKFACDKMGRRWTHVTGFVWTMIGSIPMIYTIHYPQYEFVTLMCAVFLKFSISISFYAVNLHALEIYPTCVRQTGVALGGITSNAIGTVGPYIVYLGTSVNLSYPYIIASLLGLIGAVGGLFLPETLHQKLPETLAEGHVFGQGFKIWSFPKKQVNETDYIPVKVFT